MNIQQNISLKEYTTFRIGGNAKFFCIVTNEDELIEAIGFSKKNKLPYFVLGAGSNLLISDNGFDGLIIKIEMKGIEYIEYVKKNNSKNNREIENMTEKSIENKKEKKVSNDIVQVKALAGEKWDDLVKETVEKGLYGLENLSLIPGTIGGGVVQNIGAYGSELKDIVESVFVLDVKKDEYKVLKNIDCKFSYRNSIFKEEKNRYIIISAVFNLNKKGKLNFNYKDLQEHFAFKKIENPTLLQVREAVIEIRNRKLPDLKKYGTAGSFFKNVVVSQKKAKELILKYPKMILHNINDRKVKIPIAWILDNVCGFRGVKKGNVGTYENQALVLLNYGNATAKEIIDLAQKMVDKVYENIGIEIELEVEFVE